MDNLIQKYETEENNHPDSFNKGPWYSTDICSKLHGKVIEEFIKNVRTDRYNLMCSTIAHNKQQSQYIDDEISGGGRPIPKYETTEALETMGTTLNCIDFWFKRFNHNYEEIYMMYHEAMNCFSKNTNNELKIT